MARRLDVQSAFGENVCQPPVQADLPPGRDRARGNLADESVVEGEGVPTPCPDHDSGFECLLQQLGNPDRRLVSDLRQDIDREVHAHHRRHTEQPLGVP